MLSPEMTRQTSDQTFDNHMEDEDKVSAAELASLAGKSSAYNDLTFWEKYCLEADRHDPEVIERWNRDLDSVLIFAGLFSAINTAFIVESYRDLKPSIDRDASDLTNNLLFLILNRLDNSTIGRIDLRPPSLAADPHSYVVNQLFFSSLLCSCFSAFGAVLGKQWLNQLTYITEGVIGEVRGRERQRKWSGLRKWKFETVMGFLPTVLHISLFFFLVGLIEWLLPLNPTLAYVVFAYSCTGACVYVMATITAAIYQDSPYQTPTSWYLRKTAEWWIKRLKAVESSYTHPQDSSESNDEETPKSRKRKVKTQQCRQEAIQWLLQVRTHPDTFITAVKALATVEGTSERWRIIRDTTVLPRLATMVLNNEHAKSCLHSMIKSLSYGKLTSAEWKRTDSRDLLKQLTRVLRITLHVELDVSKLVVKAMAAHTRFLRSLGGIQGIIRWSKYDFLLVMDYLKKSTVEVEDLTAGLTLIKDSSVKHEDKFRLLREHFPELPKLVTDAIRRAGEEDRSANELLTCISDWLQETQSNITLHKDFMNSGFAQTIFRYTSLLPHNHEEALTSYLGVLRKLCCDGMLQVWAPRLVQDGHFSFLAHVLAQDHEPEPHVQALRLMQDGLFTLLPSSRARNYDRGADVRGASAMQALLAQVLSRNREQGADNMTVRAERLFFALLVEVVRQVDRKELKWDQLGNTIFEEAVVSTVHKYRIWYAHRSSRIWLDSMDAYLNAAREQVVTPSSMSAKDVPLHHNSTSNEPPDS
ncbi:hypothetical protein FRC02_011239 [Tulasnella sp. 418]|nr:hypothetical protein FRC02_011239 [Tulasnella sp. 418]